MPRHFGVVDGAVGAFPTGKAVVHAQPRVDIRAIGPWVDCGRVTEPFWVDGGQQSSKAPAVGLMNLVLVPQMGSDLGIVHSQCISTFRMTTYKKLLRMVNRKLELLKGVHVDVLGGTGRKFQSGLVIMTRRVGF